LRISLRDHWAKTWRIKSPLWLLTCFAIVLNIGPFAAASPKDTGTVDVRTAPTQPAEPVAQAQDRATVDLARDAIIGIRAPHGSCSARDFRDGLLPTVINAEGAWAGERRGWGLRKGRWRPLFHGHDTQEAACAERPKAERQA
jgi:hypothetical protein